MGAQKGLPSKAVVTPIKARTLDAENPLLGIDFIITSSVGRERRGHISLVRPSYVPNFDYPRPGILHSSHMAYSVRKSSAQRLITVSAWAGSGYDWSLLRHIAYWFPLLAFLSTSCLSPLCTPSFPPKRKRESNGICPILVFNVKLGLGKATGSLLLSSTGANLPGFLCSVAILVVTSWAIRWVHFLIKVMSAYDKMVRQIDQAFYGVRPLISDNRDVDDSEMDDRIGQRTLTSDIPP
ncbi:hypothetical protein Salat_2782300 [Sesamum alatum]|uniref:Uncharacterized protein n=1 Tax=Sesamum alatum TaxID=300844 RepID=A0AAE1XKL9_9LAMI|nr:hypothetical protein Salat_2782300 [Sesamum alatum]